MSDGTHTAKLLGGPADGQIFAVESLRMPLNIASPPTLMRVPPKDEDPDEFGAGPIITTYKVAAWSQRDRCWIFTPTGKI